MINIILLLCFSQSSFISSVGESYDALQERWFILLGSINHVAVEKMGATEKKLHPTRDLPIFQFHRKSMIIKNSQIYLKQDHPRY